MRSYIKLWVSFHSFHLKINNPFKITKQIVHKQPPEVFYAKSCSKKFHKIRRKTHVPESLF